MNASSHIGSEIEFLYLSLFIFVQSCEFLRQAFNSSAGVPLVILGSVWRKSSDSNTDTLPMILSSPQKFLKVRSRASKAFWCDIVASSQTISLHAFKTLASPLVFEILQTGVSDCAKFKGIFRVECAVLPPVSNVDAIPDDATAMAIFLFFRMWARRRLIRNVFPVPPWASRKINVSTSYVAIATAARTLLP